MNSKKKNVKCPIQFTAFCLYQWNSHKYFGKFQWNYFLQSLFFLAIYTIFIVSEFNRTVTSFHLHLKSSLQHNRLVKLIVIWDCLKWHNYLTVNQIANICCYLLEARLEDKKSLVALEKVKTPLLSETLCQYEEREMTKKIWTKCWSFDGHCRQNNSIIKRNKHNTHAHCLLTVNKQSTCSHCLSRETNISLSTVNKLLVNC